MRIVGGQHRGRHIPVRKNFPSRPTTDFAKENLFNILANYFNFGEISVLDLFAGTGSISYEFASRGAEVDLIEKDPRSVSFIQDTLSILKIETVRVIRGDVFRVLKHLDKTYEIVFADPPYQMLNIADIPTLIFEQGLLAKGGWLILEHSEKLSFFSSSHFRELRKYGSVHFSIFERKA